MENFDAHKWFKKQYLEETAFGAAGTDKRTGQVVSEILELISSTGVDPSEGMEEIGQEFGINFEYFLLARKAIESEDAFCRVDKLLTIVLLSPTIFESMCSAISANVYSLCSDTTQIEY